MSSLKRKHSGATVNGEFAQELRKPVIKKFNCENIKFYDGQNYKKPRSYPQDVKPGKKANLLAIDQFFTYLIGWEMVLLQECLAIWHSKVHSIKVLSYLD